jgi:hypothetical protein
MPVPLRRAAIPLLAVAFMAASAVAVLLFDTSKTDLDVFFWPSAEIAVHGHPLLVYTLRAGQYPNANGPVSLLPLSLVVAVINALGWLHGMRLRDAVTVGVFAVFSLLMVREALLAIEAARGEGRRSAGQAGRGEGREARGDAGGGATRERFTRRLLMSAAFLLAPPLWVALVGFGHIEEPLELWLILLGVRLLGRGKTVWAGICLGLAVMTKSVSAVCLIPLLVALLLDRRVRSAAALAGTAALTAAAVIAPFFLANRSGVVYSLVTYRGELPIVGGSLWVAFLGSAWDGFVRHSDALLFAGAALVLSVAALAWRPHRGWAPHRVYGLLAVAAACVPMLAKTCWPYYLLDPYVFAAIWWLGRPGRVLHWRLAVPLLLAGGDIVLAAIEPTLPLPAGTGAVVGIAASAGTAIVIALLFGLSGTTPGDPAGTGAERGSGATPPAGGDQAAVPGSAVPEPDDELGGAVRLREVHHLDVHEAGLQARGERLPLADGGAAARPDDPERRIAAQARGQARHLGQLSPILGGEEDDVAASGVVGDLRCPAAEASQEVGGEDPERCHSHPRPHSELVQQRSRRGLVVARCGHVREISGAGAGIAGAANSGAPPSQVTPPRIRGVAPARGPDEISLAHPTMTVSPLKRLDGPSRPNTRSHPSAGRGGFCRRGAAREGSAAGRRRSRGRMRLFRILR